MAACYSPCGWLIFYLPEPSRQVHHYTVTHPGTPGAGSAPGLEPGASLTIGPLPVHSISEEQLAFVPTAGTEQLRAAALGPGRVGCRDWTSPRQHAQKG